MCSNTPKIFDCFGILALQSCPVAHSGCGHMLGSYVGLLELLVEVDLHVDKFCSMTLPPINILVLLPSFIGTACWEKQGHSFF